MKFRIARSTKKLLQEHASNKYGEILTKISEIKDIDFPSDVKNDIRKIIQEYCPELLNDYNLTVKKYSDVELLDYRFWLRKKVEK